MAPLGWRRPNSSVRMNSFDASEVIADPQARLGETRFEDWLSRYLPSAAKPTRWDITDTQQEWPVRFMIVTWVRANGCILPSSPCRIPDHGKSPDHFRIALTNLRK